MGGRSGVTGISGTGWPVGGLRAFVPRGEWLGGGVVIVVADVIVIVIIGLIGRKHVHIIVAYALADCLRRAGRFGASIFVALHAMKYL